MSGAPKAARISCPMAHPMQAAFLVSACYSGRSPLGSPAKHARPRFARRLPVAAAPALFGVAAAVALANAPAASAAQAPAHAVAKPAAAASHHAVTGLDKVVRPAAKKAAASPAKYTVKSGDSLSAIAKRVYHNPAYWPVLYWANHSQIHYANIIQVGQKLTVPAKPAKVPAAPSVLGPAAPAPVITSAPVTYGASAPAYSAPAQAASTYTGSGSFQSCVIARESGGNSQVMNSSGHYGLYQFSAGTWAAYGGNP